MKDVVKNVAKDDAKWDNSFVDLKALGYSSNKKFTAYNPPKDPKAKAVYDREWNKEKTKIKE